MTFLNLSIKTPSREKKPTGFTIVELLVTISIIVIVTGIALFKYSAFNNAVLLRSQAYEIALDIRQAQVFGVSSSGQAGNFRNPFGVGVNLNNRQSYSLFQDNNSNYSMQSAEVIQTFSVDPRFAITQFCVNNTCSTSGSAAVMFERPDYDAIINYNGNSTYTTFRLELSTIGSNPTTRTILVESSGNIAVD